MKLFTLITTGESCYYDNITQAQEYFSWIHGREVGAEEIEEE